MIKKKLGIAASIAMILFVSGWGLYWYAVCYRYPFGSEHRCDKQLWSALREYAKQHGGKFPSGQATPEASLSMLGADYAYLLHRRDVPREVVQKMLDRGQLLGPETCGWNYVEGLSIDSNPKIALFWDKEGLDEIGGRLPHGGHIISFIGEPSYYVAASDWASLLESQKELLAEEKRKMGGK